MQFIEKLLNLQIGNEKMASNATVTLGFLYRVVFSNQFHLQYQIS